MDICIKRLDHHGLVSGIIDDLGLVALFDAHLPQDEQREITAGEAIKGMIINGLGFSNKPLYLTPHFFTNLPVEHLFRPGVRAEHFNRHKLGRVLDEIYAANCSTLFSMAARQACDVEKVDTAFQSLDTTSFSLDGEYDIQESMEPTPIKITHGYSKDHRADLKQAVLEIMVSQDGGVPLMCKSWDGNASDNTVFMERSKELIASYQNDSDPGIIVADSKLYHQKNAEFLKEIAFITRVPAVFKHERELISKSLSDNTWEVIDENYRLRKFDVIHLGFEQRHLVVHSNHAQVRAEKSASKREKRLRSMLDKSLFHLQAQRFECEKDARKSLEVLSKTSSFHTLINIECTGSPYYSTKGRPKRGVVPEGMRWKINASIAQDDDAIKAHIDEKSCFVLATNAVLEDLDDQGILTRYKAQSSVESGFRFLKDPLFFVSSLFLKKPSRIESLLMVMMLSLLVYSIAQRRLRKSLQKSSESIPNQIGKATATPTMRWVFQCFEGINLLWTGGEPCYDSVKVDGMNDLRILIIGFLGGNAAHLYKTGNYGGSG